MRASHEQKTSSFTQLDRIGNPVNEAFESLFNNQESIVSNQGTVQTYHAQDVIFHQDTQPHAVYLIERGMVKLVRVMENGQSTIIGLRRRYWLMGAPAVLLDKRYFTTAITLTATSVRCIPARDFLNLAKTNEDFSLYIHLLLSQEIVKQMKSMEARNCLPTRDRMKHFLREMIDEQNFEGREPPSYSWPLTNKELAQLLAVTPEHLCRVLKEMKQERLIQCAKGVLTVTDPASLL
jgi:CRP-like cAMP-binding protein